MLPIGTASSLGLPRSSWGCTVDVRLSTTPRVGIGGGFTKFFSQGPPLFNHLRRTPENRLPAKLHEEFGDLCVANGVGFD